MRWAIATIVSLMLASLAGCAHRNERVEVASAQTIAHHTVYVVSHGWHAGVVVRAADVPKNAWPMLDDFPAAEYFEVGWGDREFYPAPDPGPWLAIKAALWSSPGVLHIVGFHGGVRSNFPASDIAAVDVSADGLVHLIRHIGASFELDNQGRAVLIGGGLYGDSRFYASRESFHLLRTCNVWTADALAAAGLPVRPAAAITVGSLFRQLRSLDRVRLISGMPRSSSL